MDTYVCVLEVCVYAILLLFCLLLVDNSGQEFEGCHCHLVDCKASSRPYQMEHVFLCLWWEGMLCRHARVFTVMCSFSIFSVACKQELCIGSSRLLACLPYGILRH
jgi:hypothetical protein